MTSAEQLPSAILGAFGYGDRVLVEERVVGRELAVTILGPSQPSQPQAPPAPTRAEAPPALSGSPASPPRSSDGDPAGPRALPIVELFTPQSFYSYEAHYTIGQLRMEVPAELSPEARERVERAALDSYSLMGCRDFARVDLILDEDEVPQILEINTIPGLTETGITTAAAEAAGMTFAELVAAIVERVTSV